MSSLAASSDMRYPGRTMAKKKTADSGTPSTAACASCQKTVPAYEITYLSEQNPLRSTPLCGPCFFEAMSGHSGEKFEHASLQPITVPDAKGRPHTFHFKHVIVPVGISLEAFEIVQGSPGGFEFQVLGDFDADVLKLFTELYQRIKRELARTHLEHTAHGLQVKEREVRAAITWDEEVERQPMLVIDGQKISWHEFGRMLMTFEGWRFKMEIYDKSEER